MTIVSNCCHSPVEVVGRITHYYVCTKCGKACDAVTGEFARECDAEIVELLKDTEGFQQQADALKAEIARLKAELDAIEHGGE